MLKGYQRYKLSMDSFPPAAYGEVVAGAHQLATELNSGETDLPGALNQANTIYTSTLSNSVFLILGISRPVTETTMTYTQFLDEIDSFASVLESRFDDEIAQKLMDAKRELGIEGDIMRNVSFEKPEN